MYVCVSAYVCVREGVGWMVVRVKGRGLVVNMRAEKRMGEGWRWGLGATG